MPNNNKLTIGFSLEDDFGNKYSATTSSEVLVDLGYTDMDFIGEQLNIFLKQCGYSRKNDFIFMESVTEEEYDALSDYLKKFRRQDKMDIEE